jgi:hypothetical protein
VLEAPEPGRGGGEARRSGLGFQQGVEVAARARGRRGPEGRVSAAGAVGVTTRPGKYRTIA